MLICLFSDFIKNRQKNQKDIKIIEYEFLKNIFRKKKFITLCQYFYLGRDKNLF